MIPARQPHSQRCEKIADRNDIIAFMKFAGFDVELAERTDGVQELTITGFDDTGDTYMLEFASITPTGENHCDKCDHWDMCEGCPYTDERATHTSPPAPAHDCFDCPTSICKYPSLRSEQIQSRFDNQRKMYEARIQAAAKAAREQAETTDNILAVLKKRYRKEMAIIDYIEMIECEVESLRAQQQQGVSEV